MVPRPTTRQFADHLLGGRLDALLAQWRAEGDTLDQIVDRLRDEHGVDVSRETVRRWLAPPDSPGADVPPAGPTRTGGDDPLAAGASAPRESGVEGAPA